ARRGGRARRLRRPRRALPLWSGISDVDPLHHPARLTMRPRLLTTAVVGSYSVPAWLERAKNDFLARRLTRHDLDEIHDTVVKAAIKDQEPAGVEVVTDGELRRDNMVDYFVERLPGVEVSHASKKSAYDFYESAVRSRLATAPLGLVADFRFL